MVYSGFWTWLHLLQLCIANQCMDPEEDALNRPWHPIPSGLISVAGARTIHLILYPSCLCLSAWLGPQWHTVSFTLVGLAYHELHFHAHWFTRNVCNAWLYGSLNAGAALVAAGTFYAILYPPWTLIALLS
jgi:4-hydroxybenzoate polyprenyltransferase